MTRITLSGQCGNSPKNELIERLTVALAIGDEEVLMRSCTDDLRWRVVGGTALQGREQIATMLRTAADRPPRALSISQVLSHGRSGAVSGSIVTPSGITREFCHVFEFSGAKGTQVRSTTTYIIDVAE
jgi:hypothetical protein